ncbi:hypothetical protein [Parabacteroides sp. Marseille-P3160]|uniref:hypothetical protein n=1 Tax=Parabacteroides sp. Marseille-P3160 TaxID=1917887 RepID=UPI0009BBC436|nr:hypothetical protein [Parabacteroides sp. Marseille-P3160]
MKKTLLILFCLTAAFRVGAQFTVSYSAGYGRYDMGDMKNVLSTIQSQLNSAVPGLGLTNVDNFPAYINHTLDIGYKYKVHEFGLKSSFLTTGGKLSRADYSGEYSVKMIVNGFREGIYYRNYFYTDEKDAGPFFSLFAELSPNVMISHLKLKEGFSIADADDKYVDEENFTKVGFTILPQAGAKYNFTRTVGILITTGYEFSFSSGIEGGDNKINWSGIRLAGGFSYLF